LIVEVHDRLAALDRGEWNGVVAASGASVFYDYDLLAAYEAHPLEPDLARAYLALRDGGGRLVGVLPAYVQDPMNAFFHLPEGDPTRDLGGTRGVVTHFWHCYDSGLPLRPELAPDEKREALAAVAAGLADVARRHGACGCGFLDVDARRPEVAGLAELGFTVRPLADRFVLDLTPFATMDDYLAGHHASRRRDLKRQRRRAEEEGLAITVREPPVAGLDEVVALCRGTAARYGGAAYYPEETFGAFLADCGDTLRVIAVEAAGTLVGTAACFLHGGTFHAWAGGMRYDLSHASPYTLVFHEILRYAIESGAHTLEGGRANARFKERLGLRPLPLVTAMRRV